MTELYAKLKRILFIVGAVIILGLPLMFLLDDFIHEAIVTPAAYVIWLVSVVVGALPDAYLLGFAVVVFVYIAFRSLLKESARPSRRIVPTTPSEGNATMWMHRLNLVTKGSYSQQRLEHHIGQLLLRVIAYENRCTLREAGQLVDDGQLDLSAELGDFIQAATSRRLPKAPNIFERAKALLLGHHHPRMNARVVASELQPALEYLEKELKIRSPEEDANE